MLCFQIRPPPFMPKSDIKIAVTEAEAKQEEKAVADGKCDFLFTQQMRSFKNEFPLSCITYISWISVINVMYFR